MTPSHLITGRRLWSLPDHLFDADSESDYSPNSRLIVNKRVRHLQTILEHFWNRWRREYLLELRENHRYHSHGRVDTVSIGDVVIIHEDTPRGLWRLGVIERKLIGRDNEIRGAVVRVKSGQGPSSFLKRPIQKLYLLEVCYTEKVSGEESLNNSSSSDGIDQLYSNKDSSNDAPTVSRARRRAATEARDKIVARLLD